MIHGLGMLSKIVESMLSHPWQLKIHSVDQNFLRYLRCSRRHRSSPEMDNTIKELLCTLTNDERCGVMLEFEYASQDKFAQLVADAPQ